MKVVKGISYIKTNEYAIFHISDLTDEIKKLLCKQLIFICYGKSVINSSYNIYNYKNTLDEFIQRYEEKDKKIKKGMIGELLSHMIINSYFTDFEIISPFFNKEERSIKKGFDVLLFEKLDSSVWITEVKSGELLKDKNSEQTTLSLIGKANRDLLDRLNDGGDRSLWINAINDAKLAFENYKDEKARVITILDNYSTNKNQIKSTENMDYNIFLVGALFAPFLQPISESTIKSKSNELQIKSKFTKLFILSIQKETYNKVYKFLKEESKNAEDRANA